MFVAEQAGLKTTLSKNPEDRFSRVAAHIMDTSTKASLNIAFYFGVKCIGGISLHNFGKFMGHTAFDISINSSICPSCIPCMTYNFHLSCKHMHLSFKSICNKEHKGVICNMTSLSNSFQSARSTGRVL